LSAHYISDGKSSTQYDHGYKYTIHRPHTPSTTPPAPRRIISNIYCTIWLYCNHQEPLKSLMRRYRWFS